MLSGPREQFPNIFGVIRTYASSVGPYLVLFGPCKQYLNIFGVIAWCKKRFGPYFVLLAPMQTERARELTKIFEGLPGALILGCVYGPSFGSTNSTAFRLAELGNLQYWSRVLGSRCLVSGCGGPGCMARAV